MEKNTILLITYNYYPVVSPEAFRWAQIAEYWVEKGYQIYVISSWQPGLFKEECINGVKIYRVGNKLLEILRKNYRQENPYSKTNRTNAPPQKPIKNLINTFLKWIHDHTWKKVYWPDYACLWYFSALKASKIVKKEKKIRNVISISIPFTAHLVGYSLKRKDGKTNWLVDITDPFWFLKDFKVNNHFFYASLNKFIEKKVFIRAEAISVLTEPMKIKYSEIYPESANKIFINPNLLALDENISFSQSSTLPGQKTSLVFIGTLHRAIRRPAYLLRVFHHILQDENIDWMELHFWGNVKDCLDDFKPFEEFIGKKIFIHGLVSKEKAMQAMHDADILVNIGNKSIYQEPSKLVEYASTAKPVLNIIRQKNDCSATFFKKYPAGLNIIEHSIEQKPIEMEKVIAFIKNPPIIDKKSLASFLLPYEIETVANAYLAMINKDGFND